MTRRKELKRQLYLSRLFCQSLKKELERAEAETTSLRALVQELTCQLAEEKTIVRHLY